MLVTAQEVLPAHEITQFLVRNLLSAVDGPLDVS